MELNLSGRWLLASHSKCFLFLCLGASTASSIVKDTCKALRTVLVEDHMPVSSIEQMEKVKLNFFTR